MSWRASAGRARRGDSVRAIRAKLAAKGRDTKGRGNAAADIYAEAEELSPTSTKCTVTADLHRGMSTAERLLRLGALVVLLYVFLVGIEVLGDGIAGLGGDVADSMFRGVSNPLGGLAVGVLATVFVQSSSVSTSFPATSSRRAGGSQSSRR